MFVFQLLPISVELGISKALGRITEDQRHRAGSDCRLGSRSYNLDARSAAENRGNGVLALGASRGDS
jgi:hypothetical protein